MDVKFKVSCLRVRAGPECGSTTALPHLVGVEISCFDLGDAWTRRGSVYWSMSGMWSYDIVIFVRSKSDPANDLRAPVQDSQLKF